MAIGTPTSVFTPVQSVTNGLTFSSGSFTPTAGALLTIAGYMREDVGSAAAPVPNISNTHSGSWSWSAGLTRGNTQSQRRRAFAFWALVPASPGSGTVTITADKDCDEWGLCGWENTDASATVTNTDTGTSTSSSPTNTLPSAPASSSYVFGACFSSGDISGLTAGSGYTELLDITPGVISSSFQVQYRTGSTSTGCAWSGANTSANIMLSWEVVEGVAVDGSPTFFVRRRPRQLVRSLED
jgi:hypothetical protein